MNNTISSVCLPKTYTYNLEGQRVSVTLHNNPFAFEPQTLYSLAARRNKKRGFLFVSKVLGKHVPVDPFIPLLAGFNLAFHFMSKIYGVNHGDTQAVVQAIKNNKDTKKVFEDVISKPRFVLPQDTLFIGFAETATGLGHAAFSAFDNAHYLHTTREKIPFLPAALDFNEVHSHAVNHRCFPEDLELLRNSKTIVLIDDEITTGNTALNIIKAIHDKFPIKDYVVLSLLDWRTKENRANYRKLEQLLKVRIQTLSLLEGEIDVSGSPFNEETDQENFTLNTNNTVDFQTSVEQKLLGLQDVISTYLRLTGRFGLSSRAGQDTLSLAQEIGEKLRRDRSGNKTLCLGTGEFMYFPMLISAYMGEGIRYHSTTRSPIYPFPKPDYGIQNGFSYPCPDDESITYYAYNIPLHYYDEVYVFLEREAAPKGLEPMRRVFSELCIPRIVFVIGSSATRKTQDY